MHKTFIATDSLAPFEKVSLSLCTCAHAHTGPQSPDWGNRSFIENREKSFYDELSKRVALESGLQQE